MSTQAIVESFSYLCSHEDIQGCCSHTFIVGMLARGISTHVTSLYILVRSLEADTKGLCPADLQHLASFCFLCTCFTFEVWGLMFAHSGNEV